MIFNSNVFLVFFVVVLLGYWLVRKSAQQRNLFIFAASLFFYGWWDWRFLGLVILTGGIDFYTAQRIESAPASASRRRWLWLSLVSNLGTLGFFKYAGFFIDSTATALASLGLEVSRPTLSIILPAGISFYTFQALGYTIDVYRGHIKAERSWIRYFAFLTFFPQLVAGPIERASFLLSQFYGPRWVTQSGVIEGLWWMSWGFFQKVVIADSLGPLVDLAYQSSRPWAMGVVFGTLAFGGQIYCDFCGYSSIARGVARILGFELSPNFAQPYLSTNIQEFWRRWHQTLSTWFRDYVYIPLGGDRLGVSRTLFNIFITFALAGLWHGANWTFLIWGIWHGVALGACRIWQGWSVRGGWKLPAWMGWILTMLVVGVGWLFFRATSLHHAVQLLDSLRSPASPEWSGLYVRAVILWIVVMLAMDVFLRRCPWKRVLEWPWQARSLIQGILLILIISRWGKSASPFIYFQF